MKFTKSNMIKVSAIDLKKIQNNVFTDQLPELYELKNVIEDSKTWHKNDSTFDHTLRAWEKIEEVLQKTDNKINSYLDQKVDKHTRRQLLFLGILFHDIGKKETIVTENGFTKCPEHEVIGAEKVKSILNRFNLSKKEKEFIVGLVRNHMLTFHVVTPSNQEINDQIVSIEKEHSDMFTELILLSMADTLGTQLKDNNPEEHNFRIDYYQKILQNI